MSITIDLASIDRVLTVLWQEERLGSVEKVTELCPDLTDDQGLLLT